MTTIYTKDNLSSPYAPGVIPSLDTYYSAVLQSGASTSTGVTLTSTSTDPAAVVAAQKSLADANAALAAVPVVDPATALADRNRLVAHYNDLLAAIADFDVKNLADKAASTTTTQAERADSLATLRILLGSSNSAWDYTGNATLCGGGSATSSCGWMKDTTPSAGYAPPANTPLTAGNTTLASTASSVVNVYLTAYGDYKSIAVYQKLKEAAADKANSAWSDRNGYKTALCAKNQSANFIGGSWVSSSSSTNPADWDVTETLLGATITNLNCTSTGTAPDFSSNQSAASAAEKTKYCTTGTSTYDAGMCSIVSGTAPARSTIQGAQNIVDALIIKGIVK